MASTSKIYANAVAKYMEGKLLDSDKIKRLQEADFSSCIKMLCDYGYNDGVNETNDIDKFIANENKRLIEFVEEYASSEMLARCLLNKYLYSNAKVAYKSKFVNVDKDIALYPLENDIYDSVRNGEYDDLPEPMVDALVSLDKMLENEEKVSSMIIDIKLTNACYKDILFCSKKLKNKNLVKIFKTEIDLNNLLTMLRGVKIGFDDKKLNDMFIDGGFISLESLNEYAHLDKDKLLDNIDERYYDLMEQVLQNDDYIEFERKIDEFLYEYTMENSDNMLTDDPFINYFYVKNLENRMVKMILVCLKNDAQSEISRRIRNIYE